MFADDTYKGIDYWTKLAGGGAGFRTMEDDSGNDIIVTNYWTFQGAGGYTPFYDSVFHRYTKSDNDQIDIGNGYKIWIWKGDYLNLGAGGEIGIYSGTGDDVATTMSTGLNIGITMDITDSSGNSIVSIGRDKNIWDVLTGNNPNENWWLTGWNPKVQGLTNKDLVMTGTLDFSNATDPTFYNKLKDAYNKEKVKLKSNLNSEWIFDDKKRKASFRWGY